MNFLKEEHKILDASLNKKVRSFMTYMRSNHAKCESPSCVIKSSVNCKW